MTDDELQEIERLLEVCRQSVAKLTSATSFRARILAQMLTSELETSREIALDARRSQPPADG